MLSRGHPKGLRCNTQARSDLAQYMLAHLASVHSRAGELARLYAKMHAQSEAADRRRLFSSAHALEIAIQQEIIGSA